MQSCLHLAAQGNAHLPDFDFTQPPGVAGWVAVHDLAPLEATPAGLVVHITGPDPYLHGPARDYPAGMLLWLHLRMRSEQGGGAQVFYFNRATSEEQSVRFAVGAGRSEEVRVPLPALGPGWRIRIDPPGDRGACRLERLWFEERLVPESPAWPKPTLPSPGQRPIVLRSGELRLVHNRMEVGGFRLEVGSEEAAIGMTQSLFGYRMGREVRWAPFGRGPGAEVRCREQGRGLEVAASWPDPDGARWTFNQRFQPQTEGVIEVETVMGVDRDRAVVYLPVFMLLPGAGSYGTNKNQALFAGVEYLENEPSSSEADVIGPESWRLVPDRVKLTLPLMAIQTGGHYLGLTWEPQPNLSAVHDSPDRQFHSGGHLMGLLMPGSNGENREERSLLPYDAVTVRAGEPWRVHATILGGHGTSVIPAVQQYVRLHGLPPKPQAGYRREECLELAASGWLESRIREGDRYRHAVWPGFNAQPAADAGCWMLWLAGRLPDSPLRPALLDASAAAMRAVPTSERNSLQVGHNRRPLPALVFDSVLENAQHAQEQGRALLRRFRADGSVLYEPRSDGVDYARTHGSREANGLAAQVVASLLEAAMVSGDASLQEAGVDRLRALDKFRQTVPRGAQTWEVPLHTPDILASAHLVLAYTLGYELTGEEAFLEEARYWAWTGVPFIYLVPPVPGAVGLYSTIPVLGATSWKAPVWLGRPVQWCGLVYADALQQFAPHDPKGPWTQLADGIVAAGWQHTWPTEDAERRGLLPDFYLLRSQRRDGPAINPATLLVPSITSFGLPAPYARHVFRKLGLIVHAPGVLSDPQERGNRASFRVQTWSPQPSWVLVNGIRATPRVTLNGQPVTLASPHAYQPQEGRLVLQVNGTVAVTVAAE